MNQQRLADILDRVAKGLISPDDAQTSLKAMAYEDIDYAHIDHHRSLRKGFPEVIFGQGKTPDQIIGIMGSMAKNEEIILVTRINREKADQVRKAFPNAEYDDAARILLLKEKEPELKSLGEILVISAGTSDIPVAKEATITAQAMGNRVRSIFDVGVAGIHRLFAHREFIENASVLVVVAGMEGALPSVVAGMVRAPVIAVPTSVGYGTSFGGMTALLGMLNSCSSNIAVVNIDNGFGAGYMAATINQMPKVTE
ncbi:MAG: nickel pincer cofactor biosynthesis protein LarB [Desulfobacterium sp.]|nr:nickel pincer cofactor biosynthesis protein LarB [Desulfobacterium sp.]